MAAAAATTSILALVDTAFIRITSFSLTPKQTIGHEPEKGLRAALEWREFAGATVPAFAREIRLQKTSRGRWIARGRVRAALRVAGFAAPRALAHRLDRGK